MILKILSFLFLASLVVDLEALRIANPSRPGKCPRSRSLHRVSKWYHRCGYSYSYGSSCRIDSQCPQFQKCCGCPRKCVAPIPDGPKPGVCPPFLLPPPGFCNLVDVAIECATDANCQGKDKCCATQCGGRVCRPGVISPTTTPAPTSNPSCPPPTFPPKCKFSKIAPKCDDDDDCSDKKICCPALCGSRDCVNKRFTPNPSCPITPTDPLPDFCAARASIPGCRVDSDCNRGRCCPDECGVPMCTSRSVY